MYKIEKRKHVSATGLTQLLLAHTCSYYVFLFLHVKKRKHLAAIILTYLLLVYLQLLPPRKFLQAKKQKLVYLLAHLQLLPRRYNFYKQNSKSWYSCYIPTAAAMAV